MRALWWLLKLALRLATRVQRRFAGVAVLEASTTADVMGAQLDVDEPRPRASLRDWLDKQDPETQAVMCELAEAYGRTFCGQCNGSPERPTERCADCHALLVRAIREMHGDEREAFARVARAAVA
jgi:hypothetical protein